ncbi:hypothetical protein [Mucisphaera sp.]|uniref:hypothetical protein n=1 Tax=Mucisphaera sp. TaxID=2913024 RepID=UPI003D115195
MASRVLTLAAFVAVVLSLVLWSPTRADLDELSTGWRVDAVWYDGLAEIAKYEASRAIYGQPRSYTARIFTNKERYSSATTTKAGGSEGREVFKHHRRDDVPTPNYLYHFSTMAYVDTRSLEPVKLEMSSQEDCGATFKQYVVDGRRMRFLQSSYFPGEGLRQDSERIDDDETVFFDSLTLVLRSFPFGSGEEIRLEAIPPQMDTRLTPAEPLEVVVREAGTEVLALPVGEVLAHRLEVTLAEAVGGSRTYDYWFAAEGTYVADGVGLHVLVKHRGPWGLSLDLKGLERGSYW